MTRQFSIRKPLARHLAHRQMEPIRVVQRVVFGGAIVEPEYLLRYIAIKVKWLNGYIGAAQPALEKTPEVLNPLSVNFSAHILFDVVDSRVYIVLRRKVIVCWESIRVDSRAPFDLIQDFIQQRLAL